MTCSSIVGRQSGLPTDGLSLGLQGRIIFCIFPFTLCFASLISDPKFLLYLASIKFILELSLFHDSFSGLALASTSIHLGLPPGTLSSLATSAGVSFPLTLPRSGDCCFPQNHIFLHIVTFACRTWSLSRVLRVENRWGYTFLLCFSFELKLHTSVSLKNDLKSSWSWAGSYFRGMRRSLGSLSSIQEPNDLIGQLGTVYSVVKM